LSRNAKASCPGQFRAPAGAAGAEAESVHKDVLAFQTKTEQRFDKVDGRLDLVERGLRGLRADMPEIVGKAVRDVCGAKPRRKS